MNNPMQFGGVPLLGAQPTVIIQATLTEESLERIETMLRKVIREELQALLDKPEPLNESVYE